MTEEHIDVQVDYNKILKIKDISSVEIDEAIVKAIDWMLTNPKKITDNILRTGRVLQFLKDKPNHHDKQGMLRVF